MNNEIQEHEVIAALEERGLQFKNGGRYILSQCPMPEHEDSTPSTQIFKDNWFVTCHSGCGRFHITKALPELRRASQKDETYQTYTQTQKQYLRPSQSLRTRQINMYDEWQKMPLIPRDHQFKNIPLEVLDNLGWRWDKNSYFIPYFNQNKTQIPFGQWRHLSGNRRFTFLKDCKPICYGLWNLDNTAIYIVEGCSDAAVMEHCLVPWIAMPSASSGELIKKLGIYCNEHNIRLIYAGDNDVAGDKLRNALDEVSSYRIKQPPKQFKDWGDFYEATNLDTIQAYCFEELFEEQEEIKSEPPVSNWGILTPIQKIISIFPGAEELKIV